MAFIVEDGTRVTDSNALIDVPFADTYHSDRGHTAWGPLTTPVKQACIIRATDFVQKRFSRRWKGVRVSFTQSLDWPRMDVWDDNRLLLAQSNQIPTKLKQAIAEYAFRAALVGELTPDPMPMVPRQDLTVATPIIPTEWAGGVVRRSNEQVDVIQENKTYERPDNLTTAARNKQTLSNIVTEFLIPEYPVADLLLEDFLRSGASRRLARA